jgi:hypothetical protein
MGHLVASVPPNSDSLYLVIIGKAPAEIPDSTLAWAGKANYRIDIQGIENEAVSVCARGNANAGSLLRNYRVFRNNLEEFAGEESFIALNSEIKSLIRDELVSESQPLLEAIRSEPDFEELQSLVAELLKFSQLHP